MVTFVIKAMSFVSFTALKSTRVFGKLPDSPSKLLYRISVLAVALSVAVMMVSVSVLDGFRDSITHKVIGFGSHISVLPYSNEQSMESVPLIAPANLESNLRAIPGVKYVQQFATKACILKANDEIEGMVFKGLPHNADFSFFHKNLLSGSVEEMVRDTSGLSILLGADIASRLKLIAGDKVLVFFVQQPNRVRKLRVAGVFSTGLEDFDKRFVLGSMKLVRKLNQWSNDTRGGIEIGISGLDELDATKEKVNEILPADCVGVSIREQYPQLFDWLKLQDLNLWVILGLMAAVAIINMVTALLILILENTSTIGLFKAMGAADGSIRSIYLLKASALATRGIFRGNLIGLLLLFLQYHFHLVSLDESSYYIAWVPVSWSWSSFLWINILTWLVCFASLLIPSAIISGISPSKALSMR
jgi:lipoprotein-releasing system permease protein